MVTKRSLMTAALPLLVLALYGAGLGQDKPAQSPPAAPPAVQSAPGLTLSVDKKELANGGEFVVRGQAAPGQAVYLEVVNANKVRSVFFDDQKPNPDTPPPHKLYLSHDIPAFYQILVPKDKAEALAKSASSGKQFAYSRLLKELGADTAFKTPAGAGIDAYQASLLASVIGSRGDLLPKLSPAETTARAMQLIKARFRTKAKLLAAAVDVAPDGAFSATVKIAPGSPPGAYSVVAYAGQARSAPVTVDNAIAFPLIYLENAGTSLNVFWPFLLTLVIAVFGVLIGAGGGFIMNPVLLALFPALPHTIVAGTVTPTVLFSQASGIYNYSKIKFISWKLGICLGLAMAAGGFIGPKLTEMVSIEQYKFVFGWILLVLAGLLFWQTTPGYLAKNKKEQAILKEYQARAKQTAKS